MVVELYPVADHTHGVLWCFKAVSVDALFLERADESLDHSVLLRLIMRCHHRLRRHHPGANHRPVERLEARSAHEFDTDYA